MTISCIHKRSDHARQETLQIGRKQNWFVALRGDGITSPQTPRRWLPEEIEPSRSQSFDEDSASNVSLKHSLSAITRSPLPIRGSTPELEEMWTLKRANPLADSSLIDLDTEQLQFNPTKRPRVDKVWWQSELNDNPNHDQVVDLREDNN